jgi:hypothetical protein
MSPEPNDVRELLGDDVDPGELERLRKVHDLLIAAGPPPELSPALQSAPRVGARGLGTGGFSWFGRPRLAAALALAAGVAAAAFGIGYLTGHVSSGSDFEAIRPPITMRGTAAAPNAAASIEIGQRDASGNVPMIVRVGGLPKLEGRAYYELYLTKNRRPVLTCGTFNGGDRVTLRFSIPYSLDGKRYDGWIVTRERAKSPHPGPTVLTTFA